MTTLFQETIEHLLKSHNLLDDFQNKDSFHVRFEKTGYQPLVIERHSEMISVAHYFEQNDDLIADPDVRASRRHHPRSPVQDRCHGHARYCGLAQSRPVIESHGAPRWTHFLAIGRER